MLSVPQYRAKLYEAHRIDAFDYAIVTSILWRGLRVTSIDYDPPLEQSLFEFMAPSGYTLIKKN